MNFHKARFQQRIEIVFCAGLAMAVGFSIGYYCAAAKAAHMILEATR